MEVCLDRRCSGNFLLRTLLEVFNYLKICINFFIVNFYKIFNSKLQGAEPILKTTTRTPESTTESLTDEKWRKYGTREGVTNERRSYSRGRHSPEILNEQKGNSH